MAFPGGGAFDFAALQEALNDPAIKRMAEQISTDPAFQGLTQQLQESMSGMLAGGGPPGAGMPQLDPANFDPSKYMQAMSGMFQNQNFMQMAEKLGQSIMQSDPNMQQMVQAMQQPEQKAKMEAAMNALKEDPELAPVFEALEKEGPAAMMKYWNDPEVLKKMGEAMGTAMPGMAAGFGGMFPGLGGGEEEEEEGEEGEEGEDDGPPTVHSAASDGNVELLTQLLDDGAAVDEGDEESRTALHFAAGYGDIACATLLIERGANVDAVDANKNSALHYAAGYGQVESVKLLLEKGADKAVKNSDDKTPVEVAVLNEHDDCVEALGGAPSA